jgi:uncharacterized protein YjeT (DUF2065 family)
LGGAGGEAVNVADLGPQMLAKLPDAARAMVGHAVSTSLRPVFWISLCLVVIGFALTFVLREVPLTNRLVAKGE